MKTEWNGKLFVGILGQAPSTFNCPGGQTLPQVRQSKEGGRVYQGHADVCAKCPYQPRCCQSQKGEARTLNTDDKEPLRQQMNVKMVQQASKDIYSKRKVIVEPVFGQLKNSGFRGFSVRGEDKVAGEFSLVCATHNIKKIAKAIAKGDGSMWIVVGNMDGKAAISITLYSNGIRLCLIQ